MQEEKPQESVASDTKADEGHGMKRPRPTFWRALEAKQAAKKRLDRAQKLKRITDEEVDEFQSELDTTTNAWLLEERGFAFGFDDSTRPPGAKTIKFKFAITLHSKTAMYAKGRDVWEGAAIDWYNTEHDDTDDEGFPKYDWDNSIYLEHRSLIVSELKLAALSFEGLHAKITGVTLSDSAWKFGDADDGATAIGYFKLRMFVRPWSMNPEEEPAKCTCYTYSGNLMGKMSGDDEAGYKMENDPRVYRPWNDFVQNACVLSPRPPLEADA